MDVGSELKQRIHDQEVKRMQGTYGPDAEMPKSQFGNLTSSATSAPMVPSAPARISELSKQLADAAHALAEARFRAREAKDQHDKAETAFALVADSLFQIINEHREGTPENVPYPR
jgi:hypothetical protein